MRVNSNNPNGVVMAVFGMSATLIGTLVVPLLQVYF